MIDPFAIGWPVSRMLEALEAGARHAGLPSQRAGDAPPTWEATELSEASFDRWVEACAEWLGVEAEPVNVAHHEVERVLAASSPSIIRLPPDGPVIVIVGRRGNKLRVVTPQGEVRLVAVVELRDAICRSAEAPAEAGIDVWLAGVVTDERRRAPVRKALVAESLQSRIITRSFIFRIPPGASFVAQLRAEGVIRQIGALLSANAVQYCLGLLAWYTLGSGIFGGEVATGWLVAWALTLVTTVPLQVLAIWLQGRILLGFETLLKRRLLAGTLRLDQDVLRREGAGQLFGRSLDAGTLEALVLSGGLFAALAVIEIGILCAALATGPGGWLQAVALLAWTAVTLYLGWAGYKKRDRVVQSARDITGDLVEQMVGHRTRLAQQAPNRWHDGEDEALDRYLGHSKRSDVQDAWIRLAPQGWAVVGLATLLPALLANGTATTLAISIGGVVLGTAAFSRMAAGLGQLGQAACAWKNVAPVYRAAERLERSPSPDVVLAHTLQRPTASKGVISDEDLPLVDASDLHFGYATRAQPTLRGASLRIRRGEHILIEGPSGGGKSTLTALIAGLRKPQSGLLLVEGLDRQTLGSDGWCRRVAAAPQYHDNHILSETLLFNLLMGRRWPPSQQDIQDAIDVCRALGLGDLLRRMPAGLYQMVGDSGWRLSHGERSRIFIARALLQDAKLIILDETFAALDPKTTERCLRAVFERAPALIVIAHP